jgi:8-oxo-dGTP diphosphatase
MSQIRVGTGVLIIVNDKILLGKRVSKHGKGTWQIPGGNVEFGEIPEVAAKREMFEETGLKALTIEKGPWIDTHFIEDGLHYISLFHIVRSFEGQIQNMEPHKCEGWQWFSLNDLPEPLFLPLQILVQDYDITNLLIK